MPKHTRGVSSDSSSSETSEYSYTERHSKRRKDKRRSNSSTVGQIPTKEKENPEDHAERGRPAEDRMMAEES